MAIKLVQQHRTNLVVRRRPSVNLLITLLAYISFSHAQELSTQEILAKRNQSEVANLDSSNETSNSEVSSVRDSSDRSALSAPLNIDRSGIQVEAAREVESETDVASRSDRSGIEEISSEDKANLKKLLIADSASYRVSEDTKTCTVIKQRGNFFPFDLTMQRSAAYLDLKSKEYNEASMSAAQEQIQENTIANSNNLQGDSLSAQAEIQEVSSNITVRSKFMNRISKAIYNIASISSYLKSLDLEKDRLKCKQAIANSDIFTKVNTEQELYSFQATATSETTSADRNINIIKVLSNGIQTAKDLNLKDVVKACEKYRKNLSNDLIYCKESLSSFQSTTFLDFIKNTINELSLINNAYASKRDDIYGVRSSEILEAINENSTFDTKPYMSVPYDRGSVSYGMAKAKEGADAGYSVLKNIQDNNSANITQALNSLNSNSTSLAATGTTYSKTIADSMSSYLDSSANQIFKGVDQVTGKSNFSATSGEASVLGKYTPRYRSSVGKALKVIKDYDTGNFNSEASIANQNSLVSDLGFLSKLNEQLKKKADSVAKSQNRKTPSADEKLSSSIKEGINKTPIGSRNLIATLYGVGNGSRPSTSLKDKIKVGNKSRDSLSTSSSKNVDLIKSTLLSLGGGKESSEIEPISITLNGYDIFCGRIASVAEMKEYALSEDAEISKRKETPIWEIITLRYHQVAPRLLNGKSNDVSKQFGLE